MAGIQSAGKQDAYVLPIAEYVRRVVISAARDREIDAIVTNSDGRPGASRQAPTRIHRARRFGGGDRPWGRRSKAAAVCFRPTVPPVQQRNQPLVQKDKMMGDFRRDVEIRFQEDASRLSPGRLTGTLLTYEQRGPGPR